MRGCESDALGIKLLLLNGEGALEPNVARMKFTSLFCGAGGLDLGFIKAGFEPVAAFDISANAVRHYELNIGPHARVQDLADPAFQLDECDLVIAGSPCQGFSTLGKRNHADPRNKLLQRAVELAISARPKVIVLENVLGLTSGALKSYMDGAVLRLSLAGYKVLTQIVDARDCGLPQARRRIVIIAAKGKFLFSFDENKVPMQCLGKIIYGAHAAANHQPELLFGESLQIAKKIGPGQKLCDVRGGESAVHSWQIPEVFGSVSSGEVRILESTMRLRRRDRTREFGDGDPVEVCKIIREAGLKSTRLIDALLKKQYLRLVNDKVELKRTFNGKYRRAVSIGASHTVDTRFSDPACFLHPSENRGFTVREAARIQGFPDHYVFHGRDRDSLKLIGNAVPPPMATMVAEVVSRGLVRARRV